MGFVGTFKLDVQANLPETSPIFVCPNGFGEYLFSNVYKGQLNSELIYEVIVSPKMPTKNFSDFCPGGLLEVRAEI